MAKPNKITKPNKKSNVNNSISSMKKTEARKKQVFKPILDSPYTSNNWPFIKPETQSDITNLLKSYLKTGNHLRGFNSVVKALERQAQKNPSQSIIKYVIVCKNDINPVLADIFPQLCITASRQENVKLIQLPKSTFDELETSIIGISRQEGVLFDLLEQVDDVDIPWLKKLLNNEGQTKYYDVKIN